MIEGPTIGDWTQYGWIPDEVSSFPARVRLRDAAWMVYYEANVGDERERTEMLELRDENAELRKLVRDMDECLEHSKPFCKKCKFQELDCQWFEFDDRMRELGIEVDE